MFLSALNMIVLKNEKKNRFLKNLNIIPEYYTYIILNW